jgi:arylsulfatase A-like enzyme
VFRGTKADIWEGGHRVPFFARWPGQITAGDKCDQTICLTDFFATAADILDAHLPEKAAPDSFSFLPALEGKNWQRPAPVIHHSVAGMFAIREGRWKLVAGNGSGGREAPRGKPFEKPYQLFDLAGDITEQSNVITAHQDVAERLTRSLEQIRENERRW